MEQRLDHLDPQKVRRLLILYELRSHFIGDSCQRFARLEQVHVFFPNAIIDINTVRHYKVNSMLLKNNPYVSAVRNNALRDIPFEKYDLVISVSDFDKGLKKLLEERVAKDSGRYSKLLICSIQVNSNATFFPQYQAFNKYLLTPYPKDSELYLDRSEISWANSYLRKKGISNKVKLIVYLDTSSNRKKLIRPSVSIRVVEYFAKCRNCKVLIFDENVVGKKRFYRRKLDRSVLEKVVFAERLTLRQGICILGSKFTKMVLGPSTGLLHCASGAYRNFLKRGMRSESMPALLAYLGSDPKGNYDEWQWWGNSLAKCILLKSIGGKNRVFKLNEKNHREMLPCKEYSLPLLVSAIKKLFPNSPIKKAIDVPLID